MLRVLLIAALVSQSPEGTLRVTVVDPSGAIIVSARVTLTSPERPDASVVSDGRGEARIEQLPPGRYRLTVQSDGFEVFESEIRIGPGQQQRSVRMSLAKIAQTITVDRDPQERASDPRGDIFTTILSQQQIDQLPDDPDEMARVLLDMAGPGASIRVNGFRSNRLPPKDQIQQVRFRRNAFAADTHEAGAIFVDVVTKPGGESWRGTTGAGIRSSALNARPALAVREEDESLQRYSLSLSGPLWKSHTSAALSIDASSAVDARTILAVLPEGPWSDVSTRPLASNTINARIEHALSPSHVLRLEADRSRGRTDRAGVGDFDLPERGYRQQTNGHGVRASAVGPIGRVAYNEVRAQWRADTAAFTPSSVAPAVLVLNAFNAGGAQLSGERTASYIEAADDVDVARGSHALRAGVLFEQLRVDSTIARNATGTFTFSSLDAFRAGRPTTYSRNTGDPRTRFSINQLGMYVQDDFRVRKNLTLSAGLRQEYQSIVGEWLLGPRAAVTWSPFVSGKTSVRAGAGLFFDWFDANSYEYAQQLNGSHQQIITVVDPIYPLLRPGDGIALPLGRVTLAAGLEQPRIAQGSIAIEHAVMSDLRVSTSWIRRRGDQLLRGVDINTPVNGSRPDRASGQIIEIDAIARSSADTVMLQATFSPPRPLFVTATYTWTQSQSDTDGPTSLPADARNLAGEWGPSLDDIRHRLTTMFTTRVVGRVRFGTSMRWQSGAPYNITTGRDDNGDTTSNDRPAGVSRNSARGASHTDISARLGWTVGFVDRPSTGGSSGALARTKGDGDALAAFGGAPDVTKRYNLEIYAQAYNLLNHVNVTSYAGVMTSPLFGRPVAVAPARRIELGARLRF